MDRAFLFMWLICQACTNNPKSATNIYKKAINSIVTIETDNGQCSGFFIEKNAIVTNYSFIEGAENVYYYPNNSSTKIKIDEYLGVDESADLIIFKVNSLNKKSIKISADSISLGQPVYVIGRTTEKSSTLVDGYISGFKDYGEINLLQITSSIYSYSSGGPVLNSNGELIGISSGQKGEGQRLNFAIPKLYLKELLTKKKIYPDSIKTLSNTIGYLIDKRDGQSYKTIKIGTQIWMAENLNYSASPGSWCYDNNPSNSLTYGRLYTWEVAKKSCPDGWHLPSDDEWTVLIDNLGGRYIAGSKLKSQDGWKVPRIEEKISVAQNLHKILLQENYDVPLDYASFENIIMNLDILKSMYDIIFKDESLVYSFGAPSSFDNFIDVLGLEKKGIGNLEYKKNVEILDKSNFSALPAGGFSNYLGDSGIFKDIGENAFFWSSGSNNGYGLYQLLDYKYDYINRFGFYGAILSFSVRCVKDQ